MTREKESGSDDSEDGACLMSWIPATTVALSNVTPALSP